jgi:sulfatase modifying factor 1
MRDGKSVGWVSSLLMATACNTSDALLGSGDAGRHEASLDGGLGGDQGAGEFDAGIDGTLSTNSDAGKDSAATSVDAGSEAEAAGVDAGRESGGDGGGASPTSCQTPGDGISNCGPNAESCCTSPVVPGGTFYRSFDGITYTDRGNPATISTLRLDKYEITVGRFRQFVSAVIGGWLPAAGDGKHAHLNGAQGLADSSSGGFETGWNSLWDNNLGRTAIGWDANLSCTGGPGPATWTPSVAGNEKQPINCINWYQAYAFCIWDGGFLPSETEWNYAASAGSEQRVYPWSSPASTQTIDCTYSNYGVGGIQACPADASGLNANNVGSDSPKGDGKWGQADLAGNVFEWNLDWYANYAVPCVDCGYLSGTSEPVTARIDRGGSYIGDSVLSSYRVANVPTTTLGIFGARCARAP